jgi:hypothetical protein
MNEAIKMVPGKTDVEIAKDLAERVSAALVPVCAILDEARAHGFDVAFRVAPDWKGKMVIADNGPAVSKRFV